MGMTPSLERWFVLTGLHTDNCTQNHVAMGTDSKDFNFESGAILLS